MRDDILTTLRALRDELNTRFRVREISLFGSVVHEERRRRVTSIFSSILMSKRACLTSWALGSTLKRRSAVKSMSYPENRFALKSVTSC